MKKTLGVCLLVGAAILLPGCTNKQGETEAPVFLTVDLTLQPGFVNVGVTPPVPVQVQTITLNSHFKDPTATDPQGFQAVSLETYTVHFVRTDGGTKVPPDFTSSVGVLVPSNGTSVLSNFPILPASDLQASPFDQLLPFNGGIDRETGKAEIDMQFQITFFGHTIAGDRVQSSTADGVLEFVDTGVTPLSRSVRVR